MALGGGHPRPLPARGRGRLRTDRRGSARRGAGLRRHPRRRWWQGVLGRWLWVVLSAPPPVFHMGSPRHEEIRDLLGDAILGWLVTDGYGAYRDYARRQRCLAHYADAGIMPTAASKPAPAAVFAAMGSA